MSCTNRPLLSLSRIIQKMKLPGWEIKTTVAVGDSHRWCADSGSTQAKGVCTEGEPGGKSHPPGGKILTSNPLALESPKGGGTMLLSGPQKGQEVSRHFNKASGTPHNHTNHTKPYICPRDRKFKCARGRWAIAATKTTSESDLTEKKKKFWISEREERGLFLENDLSLQPIPNSILPTPFIIICLSSAILTNFEFLTL